MNDAYQYGDAPVEAEFKRKMVAIIQTLDEFMNDGKKGKEREIGILVMSFRFNTPGRCNFMSNGVNREDVVTLMREMIERFEGS